MNLLKQGLAASLLAAVAALSFLAPASAEEQVSVRLKWLPQAQFAGIYMAKEKGFYRDAGLDVTINPGGPNINVETLAASGTDTFAIGGPTESVLYARDNNLPLVAIGMTLPITSYVFVAHADSGIKDIQDFKGKKVATWFTGSQYTLFGVLAHENIEQSELEIIAQPFTLQPFIDKQFDVYTVTLYNELNTLREMGMNDLTIIRPDDHGVTTQVDSILTSEKVIEEKPEVVQAFLTATLKGWKYALAHKEESIDVVMTQGSGLDRKHQELMLDEIERLIVDGNAGKAGIGGIDMDVTKAVQDNLLRFDALKAPVDLDAAFTNRFWDQVPADDKKL
ncbi:MAG: ABC transporter substrate-binding protein [Rhizobiaceae bacterium]